MRRVVLGRGLLRGAAWLAVLTLLAVQVSSVIVPAVAMAKAGSGAKPSSSAPASSAPALPRTTSPFSPGVPQAPLTAPTQTTPTPASSGSGTSTSSGGGLSGSSAIAIAIGAVILLGGISYFIWHDARRHAPVKHGAGADAAVGGPNRGSKAPPKPRKLSPAERRRRKRGRAKR